MSNNLDIKVSDNFSLKEYLKSDLLGDCVPINDIQYWLIKKHAKLVMQPIRDEFGMLIITSAVRNKEIIKLMNDSDEFSPSTTTDHSFLDPEVYPYGVGAADFYAVDEPNLLEIQQWIMKKALRFKLPVGQSIIYWDSKKEDFVFIHVSLLRSIVFAKEFAYDNLRDYGKFLVGFDRGNGGYKQIYLKNNKIVALPERIIKIRKED